MVRSDGILKSGRRRVIAPHWATLWTVGQKYDHPNEHSRSRAAGVGRGEGMDSAFMPTPVPVAAGAAIAGAASAQRDEGSVHERAEHEGQQQQRQNLPMRQAERGGSLGNPAADEDVMNAGLGRTLSSDGPQALIATKPLVSNDVKLQRICGESCKFKGIRCLGSMFLLR